MFAPGAQTIENTRVKDVTMIAPDDAEVEADDAEDEFASAFFTFHPACVALAELRHAFLPLHSLTAPIPPCMLDVGAAWDCYSMRPTLW